MVLKFVTKCSLGRFSVEQLRMRSRSWSWGLGVGLSPPSPALESRSHCDYLSAGRPRAGSWLAPNLQNQDHQYQSKCSTTFNKTYLSGTAGHDYPEIISNAFPGTASTRETRALRCCKKEADFELEEEVLMCFDNSQSSLL